MHDCILSMGPHSGLTLNDFNSNDMKFDIFFSLRMISSSEKWLDSFANMMLIVKCEFTFVSPSLKRMMEFAEQKRRMICLIQFIIRNPVMGP